MYYEKVSVFLSSLAGMQIASFLRHIIMSSLACPALPYFPALSHKRHDFMILKSIECKMRVLIVYIILSETSLFLTRIHI